MPKRKRDIFPIREAVPNWFDAREGATEPAKVVGDQAIIYVANDQGEGLANGDQLYQDPS